MVTARTGKIEGGLMASLLALAVFAAGFGAYLLLDRAVFSNRSVPDEYVYNIDDLAKIDPAMLLYRQVGEPIDTGLKSTAAIELDAEGNLYVAGEETVAVFNDNGQPLRQIPLSASPTALAVARDGSIYAALGDHIEIYSPDGQLRARWHEPADLSLLTAIAVGKEDVFAADAISKVVWRFDQDGAVKHSIGAQDPERNIPGILVPSPYFDLLIAPDGLLRVVNPGRHRIEAYTFDGHLEWFWGRPSVKLDGFSGCCNPVAFAMLPGGGFVTCEKGLVRVKVHDEEGQVIGAVAGPDQLGWQAPLRVCETPEQCQDRGLDVVVSANGRVYVLDRMRNRVHRFEKR